MTLDLNLAMISGALMFLGYALYIGLTLKRDVEPNPTTWLMFAYGTVLLTILELDRLGWNPEALMGVLVVPIACSISGVIVALICLRRGTLRWPSDWEDRISFITDLILTAGYVTAGVLLAVGYIVPEQREFASLLFLICSNLTAITAFVPILRHTRRDQSAERS
jgi:Ca2+/Na+ antiporter